MFDDLNGGSRGRVMIMLAMGVAAASMMARHGRQENDSSPKTDENAADENSGKVIDGDFIVIAVDGVRTGINMEAAEEPMLDDPLGPWPGMGFMLDRFDDFMYREPAIMPVMIDMGKYAARDRHDPAFNPPLRELGPKRGGQRGGFPHAAQRIRQP